MTEQTKEKLKIKFKPFQFIESNGVLLKVTQNPKKAVIIASKLVINIPITSRIYWLQRWDYVIVKNGVYRIVDIKEEVDASVLTKRIVHCNFYNSYSVLEQSFMTPSSPSCLHTRDIDFMITKGLHVVSKEHKNLLLELVTRNKIYKK